MPSKATRGDTDQDWEPSEFGEEFDEDPARRLSKGPDESIPRIRGIVNSDLLDAYLAVELERYERQDVIAAINQRKHQLKQSCPRGCDAPVMDRFETTDPFQIKHVNAVQYKTCVTPRIEDGEASVIVVLHDEPAEPAAERDAEPADAAPDPDDEADAADADPAEADDDDADDPDEADMPADEPVGNRPKRLYHKLRSTDGSMTLASIKGWCANEMGLSPDETQHVLDSLVNGGYVQEIADAVYTVPTE